ncbi:hypothetical protein KBZ18_01115 [Synechococcus sp. Cruz-9H2]|uniref:hypothetical protein n=1 Tax=unclassified Synechococcus TaxID=2626047 RepID=UPI0020CF2620|nr:MULTISPECIES: hypothetical protein [unclassified Synechococcus]MCP9818089.1 hypothetical protein [Synechococcus sp. Cruz-9H2]MCP9842411.1 hypothetical protein [Synechococcus sp. Edmonson 11F2]MCP9854485.1 hypothetical protein [Synechococcus sp. Cruz-9C9]MCP9861819.1 hypothetical protein [Synechococcus sp. Cruz-7E5]MCP9868997.1 hypothetical protein [Synechococcus sp. Cruz-7B9]
MERSGSELPVVYESPWRALGRDLRAVAASCALALRRIWRRQWQGDLPTPQFWPRRQATLFWPAALLLALLLLALAGRFAIGQRHPLLAERPVEMDGSGPSASVVSPPLSIDPAVDPAQAPEAPVEAKEDRREPRETVGTSPEPVPPPQATPSASETPIQLPPGFSDESGLVLAAPTGGRGGGVLRLRISEAFNSLPESERQGLAQQWWQQSLDLGYEQLRLLDTSDAELGRNAVVGGGMILLD